MSLIVLGTFLMSLVYPLARLVDYYHTQYTSAYGHTRREKGDHLRTTLGAVAQFCLLAGIAMFAWGVCEVFVSDQFVMEHMLEPNRINSQNVDKNPTHVMPIGP